MASLEYLFSIIIMIEVIIRTQHTTPESCMYNWLIQQLAFADDDRDYSKN